MRAKGTEEDRRACAPRELAEVGNREEAVHKRLDRGDSVREGTVSCGALSDSQGQPGRARTVLPRVDALLRLCKRLMAQPVRVEQVRLEIVRV